MIVFGLRSHFSHFYIVGSKGSSKVSLSFVPVWAALLTSLSAPVMAPWATGVMKSSNRPNMSMPAVRRSVRNPREPAFRVTQIQRSYKLKTALFITPHPPFIAFLLCEAPGDPRAAASPPPPSSSSTSSNLQYAGNSKAAKIATRADAKFILHFYPDWDHG